MRYTLPFLFCLALLAACSDAEKEAAAEEALRPVRYGQVMSSGGGIGQSFSGRAQSSKEAQLSFKVNGTINRLFVKIGDRVKPGQPIAALDAVDYRVQYEQAVANLKSAETQIKSSQSQLITARSNYQRVETLFENNSVSLSEFEQAKANMEAAESQHNAALAQVTAAQKQVESARNQVAYAQLKAPFAGIITAVNVEENEMAGAGSPIAALSALARPEVSVGVPEVFITRISRGQKVEIRFSTLPGQPFTGTVTEVGFSASGSSTYPVIIGLDNPGEDIRPGMAADVRFQFKPEEKEGYLVAPVQAIGEGSDGRFVFLLEKDGEAYKVKKQMVTVGELRNNGFEITDGLQAGDLVATAGLNSLLGGMRVALKEE
ncbi:MAG: efflux RND transporter periplasmic adaptor subunit [Lewinellaceae bacterium]|nr:efflux RND transporter periplasmic adaptor subunit [Lewinellaceae bacterium]